MYMEGTSNEDLKKKLKTKKDIQNVNDVLHQTIK